MALNPVTRHRSYKGACRSCKAPEMVLCKKDCKYVDPWADYYMGPREHDRLKARAIRAKEESNSNVHRVSFTGPTSPTHTGDSQAQTAP